MTRQENQVLDAWYQANKCDPAVVKLMAAMQAIREWEVEQALLHKLIYGGAV